MATLLLTDALIRSLAPPGDGIQILRDNEVRGLGVRILPSGTKAFILDYVIAGRRRIYTIGKCAEWNIKAARKEAERLKRLIREDGFDPAQSLKEAREAPTVSELCERFKAPGRARMGVYGRTCKTCIFVGNARIFGSRAV